MIPDIDLIEEKRESWDISAFCLTLIRERMECHEISGEYITKNNNFEANLQFSR